MKVVAPFGAAVLIGAAVFIVDFLTPLGVSDGVLYVAMVVTAAWMPNRRNAYLLALAGSLLTIAGALVSPPENYVLGKVLANRVYSIIVLWIAAASVAHFSSFESRLVGKSERLDTRFLSEDFLRNLSFPEKGAGFTAILLFVVIFQVDLLTPLGVADGMLYVAPINMAIWMRSPASPLVLALASTILTVMGYSESPPGGQFLNIGFNRLFSIAIQWIAAVGIFYIKRLQFDVRRLVEVVDRSPASVIVTDGDGVIQYVNHQVLSESGYRFEELKGKTPRVFKSGLHPEEFYRDLWRTIGSGRRWSGDIMVRKKDGGLLWESMVITPVADTSGRTVNYIGVRSDISERRALEHELADHKALLESLLESLQGLAVIAVDLEGRVLFRNPEADRLFGRALAGMTLEEIHKEAGVEMGQVRRALGVCRMTGSHEFRAPLPARAGQPRRVMQAYLGRLKGAFSDLQGFVMAAFDVTEKVAGEEKTARQMKSLDEFARLSAKREIRMKELMDELDRLKRSVPGPSR